MPQITIDVKNRSGARILSTGLTLPDNVRNFTPCTTLNTALRYQIQQLHHSMLKCSILILVLLINQK